MDLSGNQHRIDDTAEIVDAVIGDDLRMPGVGIDLDFADMAAVREGRGPALIHRVGIEAVLEARQFLALQGHGELADRDRLAGAGHREGADAFDDREADVVAAGLEHLPRRDLALLDDFVRRQHQGAARHVERARAAGAATVDPFGVALFHRDGLERHAELLGDELGEGGLVPLPVRLGAAPQFDAAIVGEFDRSGLLAGGAGDLDIVAEAEAAQLAAAGGVRLARREAGLVGALEAFGEQVRIIAGIVFEAPGVLVGQLRGRRQVAQADLGTVEAGLSRRRVHQAVHQIGAFGAPGAAIGIDRRGVGEIALHIGVGLGHAVDAAEDAAAGERGYEWGVYGQITAHIGGAGDAQGGDLAVLVERELAGGNHVAAMVVGEEAFGALGAPAHGTADLLSGDQHRRLLGIEEALHAEAAADILGDDAQLFRRDVEHHARQAAADVAGAL